MRPDRTAFKLVLILLAVMWVSEVVDTASGHKLDELGIEPRDPDGLIGVGTAPFLHAGFGHLLSNTLPFVILGLVLAFEGLKRLVVVTVIVMLVSGLGTWLCAECSIATWASSRLPRWWCCSWAERCWAASCPARA